MLVSVQALASVAVPCSLAVEIAIGEVVSEVAEAHHAHHGMSDVGDIADGEAANNCCDAGYCSQGGCLTVAAAANDALPPLARKMHAPSPPELGGTPLATPHPLFRPPSA